MSEVQSLRNIAALSMGETIIASDCDGQGFPIYSADTGDDPWNWSSKIKRKNPYGTIVVGARGSIGFARLPPHREFGATQTTITVVPDGIQVKPRYLLHALRAFDFSRVTAHQAIPMLTVGEFSEVQVWMPEILQQAKIALILDTLDTAIVETETIIAKLKAVKHGLLHDLLTRGIDANGELRPPQPEAPHLYKESPLGWIPSEWSEEPLAGYTASEVTYGIVQAGPHIPGGVPYIRTGDMSGDALVRDSMLCTSRRIASSYARSEIKKGEIVMAIRATVGKVLPVPDELDGANLTQGTARISPNSKTDGVFLLWAIRHSRAQKAIQLEIKGTTFAEITLGALRQVRVAAPAGIDEQREIAKRLTAVDERLSLEHVRLAKQHSLKSALMDDLLTGRVRVTPLLAPATP